MFGEPSRTITTEPRKFAAIMLTDIKGFSRQMGADEKRMLRLLDVHNQLIRQAPGTKATPSSQSAAVRR